MSRLRMGAPDWWEGARAHAGGEGGLACIRGHDRTGIIALLLLGLVGVRPEEMIADYELSPDPRRDELLAGAHCSVREAILSTLEGLEVDGYLRMGGASQADLAAVRKRLLG